MSRALVGNATDREQVKRAGRKEKDRRAQELQDLKDLLASAAGRRVIWRMLAHCGVFASTYDHSGSRSAYNSGMQDTGHFILAEVNEADPDAFTKMMIEDRQAQRREAIETEALQMEKQKSARADSDDE
jgi:DNA-binding GntR family transcriptional regulator